jgi:hypothetical protein
LFGIVSPAARWTSARDALGRAIASWCDGDCRPSIGTPASISTASAMSWVLRVPGGSAGGCGVGSLPVGM